MRRVRSEENFADLGTKPLSKTVIAKHCLTLGYPNMDEETVWCGWQVVSMFWDFGSAVSSQWQEAGDHVQKSASRDPQQQKQLQDSQQRQHASGDCSRCCCSTLPRIVTHCSKRLRKVQTGRTHTSSSAETSSESVPNVSVARNSRQIFTEHREVRRCLSREFARRCHVVPWHRRALRDW